METSKTIQKRHVFGTRSDVQDALHWLDDGFLLYPVGKTIVLQHPQTNHQRFLEASYQSTGVSALAVSANRKFIAIAESGPNAQIQIIDTVTRKRRKVLSVQELGSDKYVCVGFSSDGRHLVAQGGAPEWNLYYWNWERSRPLASVSIAALRTAKNEKTPGGGEGGTGESLEEMAVWRKRMASPLGGMPVVSSVSVCPRDPLLVSVAGAGFFRLYRYTDGLLQPQPSSGVPREAYEAFTAHAWLDDMRLLTATRSGSLLLMENGRYLCTIFERVPTVAGALPTMGHRSIMKSAAEGGEGGDGDHHGQGRHHGDVDEEDLEELPSFVTQITPTHRGKNLEGGFVVGTSHGEVLVYTVGGSGRDDPFTLSCSLTVPRMEPGEALVLQPARPALAPAAATAPAADQEEHTALTLVSPHGGSTDGHEEGASDKSGGGRRAWTKRRFHLQVDGSGVAEGSTTSGAPTVASSSMRGGGASLTRSMAGGLSQTSHTHRPLNKKHAGDVAVPTLMWNSSYVMSMALDQAEECLAVMTVSGKLYGVDFRQDWTKLEEHMSQATSTTTAAGTGARGGGAGIQLLPSTRQLQNQGKGGASQGSVAASEGPRAQLFTPLFHLAHCGTINGMDCCVRKPLLLTSGSDHSIRIWNTQAGRCIMTQFFKLEPGAVAIHPDGLMAVVCFSDRVRVMSVLWNSLRERRSISLRNATSVLFSKGGQYFAVAHNNLIDIFNSNTCEMVGQLRGHPQKIQDMSWCATTPYPTDNRMVSCAADGMLMDWDMKEMRKHAEHADKRYQYRSIASDDRSVWVVAVPTSATALEVNWKSMLREVDRHCLSSVSGGGAAGAGGGAGPAGSPSGAGIAGFGGSVGDYEFIETVLTRLAVAGHQRVLVAGGEDGSVKAMTFPLQAGVQESPLTGHGKAVTHMVFSFDETTLYTAGADGSLVMWAVLPDAERQQRQRGGEAVQTMQPQQYRDPRGQQIEEVLVTRQEVEEQKLEAASLRQLLEKMKTDMETEEKQRAHESGTRAREKAERFQQEAVMLAEEFAALHNAKLDQERAFLAVRGEREADTATQLEQLERTRQTEVDHLEDACTTLQHTLDKEKSQHAQMIQQLERDIEQRRHDEAEHYADVLTQRREALQKHQRQLDRSKESNRVTQRQLELDTDAEMQSIQGTQQGALNTLRSRYLHMKGEGAVMRTNAARLEREIEVRSSEVQLLDSAKSALQAQLAEHTHQVTQLHQDIEERDAVIGQKEKIIYTLKKQNQELEKHKFVLDHHIRELKGQIDPKQREIALFSSNIKDQNAKLTEEHHSNLRLRESMGELKQEIADQQTHLKGKLRELSRLDTYRTRVESDIAAIASALQDPASLQAAVSRLYDTHVAPRGVERVAPADPSTRKEFASQLEFLSASVEALQRKLRADQARHKTEVSAMMSENLAFIRETHELRREIAEIKMYLATTSGRNRTGLAASPARGKRKASSVSPSTASGRRPAPPSSSPGARLASSTPSLSSAPPSRGAGGRPSLRSKPETNPLQREGEEGSQKDLEDTEPYEESTTAAGTVLSGAAAATSTATPPPALEENRRELRMLRAYVDAMERALTQRPSSASSGVRLPPVQPNSGE